MDKLDSLVAAVRKLAQDAPANRYTRAVNDRVCSYDRGSCTNGSIGCLIGQALHVLDYRTDGVTGGIRSVVRVLLGVPYEESTSRSTVSAVHWLDVVQMNQDRGDTWSHCIEVADAMRQGGTI